MISKYSYPVWYFCACTIYLVSNHPYLVFNKSLILKDKAWARFPLAPLEFVSAKLNLPLQEIETQRNFNCFIFKWHLNPPISWALPYQPIPFDFQIFYFCDSFVRVIMASILQGCILSLSIPTPLRATTPVGLCLEPFGCGTEECFLYLCETILIYDLFKKWHALSCGSNKNMQQNEMKFHSCCLWFPLVFGKVLDSSTRFRQESSKLKI